MNTRIIFTSTVSRSENAELKLTCQEKVPNPNIGRNRNTDKQVILSVFRTLEVQFGVNTSIIIVKTVQKISNNFRFFSRPISLFNYYLINLAHSTRSLSDYREREKAIKNSQGVCIYVYKQLFMGLLNILGTVDYRVII